MVDISIWPTYGPNIGDQGQKENSSAVKEFKQQMEDRAGLSVKLMPQVEITQYRDDSSDLAMAQSAADYLYNNNDLKPHDTVLHAHGSEEEGFGVASNALYTPYDAPSDWGGVSISTHLVQSVGEELAENMGMHELLHTEPFVFNHCHGRYWVNGSDEIYLVSPMASTYTFENYGHSNSCDSEHCGATFCATSGPGDPETPDQFIGKATYSGLGTADCSEVSPQPQESPYGGGNFDSSCPLHTKTMSEFVIDFTQTDPEPGTSGTGGRDYSIHGFSNR